ncbi:MAG: discoidin domain-containing protein, partial [Candidatus Kariarchaeaceae archaeon]
MAEEIIAPPCEEPEDLTDCVVEEEATIPSGCIETPNGIKCPNTAPSDVCRPFQLSENADECIIEDYVEEALNIGGAQLNVFKLLGVHEQGQLTDQTGNGTAISGGDTTNFPAENAFDEFVTAWRSLQTGAGVTASSFIGYDFGIIRLNNLRTMYGDTKDETRDVSTLRIKQASNANNRVTRARVERSNDAVKWFGVDVVDLPDCDKLVTVNFRRSVPSRYWRLRPVEFSGGDSDFWGVAALELIDYEQTQVSNIQDRLFLENRSRDYNTPPTVIKGFY